MRTRFALSSALLALGTACSNPPAPGSGATPSETSTDQRSATLGDTVYIALGRSAPVDHGRLVLTFRAHGTDSRCPANVVCVWMGDIAVRLAARTGSTSTEVELHTGVEPRTSVIGPYTVKLVGVLPYPGTTPEGQRPTPTAVVVVTSQ